MIYIFDIIKLIMSFFVAATHLNPLESISPFANFYLVNCIWRIAVPIFFSIAGYLLYRKLIKDKENYNQIVLKYLKKIFIVYLIWSIIYYIPYSGGIISTRKIIKFIMNFFIKGVYSQLWYLQSLIIGVILSTFLSKKIGIRKTLLISFLLYTIGLATVPYFPILNKFFHFPTFIVKIINIAGYKVGRNGIFFGMFFITLGGYIEKYFKKSSTIKSIICLIISILLLIAETTLIRFCKGSYYGLQLSLVPVTFFSMNLMLNYNTFIQKQTDTNNIRKLSFLIYLIHEWISYVYTYFQNIITTNTIFQNSLIKYIIILLITIFLAEIIIYMSENKKFKFLKKVY